MVEHVIALGWPEVLLLLVLMLAAMVVSLVLRLGLTQELAVGTARSVVQLSAVGFVIGWVFQQRTWYWVLLLLAAMALVAGYTGARRTRLRLPGLTWLLTGVLVVVSAVVLLYLTQAVLGLREWDPRYLIPLGGMLLGNAMNSSTLAVERLVAELARSAGDVEALLALGASPGQAVQRYRHAAISAAVTPAINGLLTVGIVTLPGMMTGQMLGGTAPLQAALYQLMILFGITLCALLGAILAVYGTAPRFFTPAWQLQRAVLRAAR
ncbi:MAG TPA: iron export ABC transporter permease subunit FetB [bacterium]|nr:iron export ABC transporter permease subunit FetB [bacterium]